MAGNVLGMEDVMVGGVAMLKSNARRDEVSSVKAVADHDTMRRSKFKHAGYEPMTRIVQMIYS